jgi:hypothetical protein
MLGNLEDEVLRLVVDSGVGYVKSRRLLVEADQVET